MDGKFAYDMPPMGVVGILRFLAILWIGILFFSCGPKAPAENPIHIGLRSIVNKLDPLSESTLTSGAIYYNVYDRLVSRDRNLVLRPSLATTWSTPDELTWLFELRKGVRFSDGSPLTAADVKFSLERMRFEKWAYQAAALAMLERVDVLDDHKVRIVTTHPSSTLLVRLADILIVPHTTKPDQEIYGTGPYRVTQWQPGRYVYLEANPYYWGNQPATKQVHFELYTSTDQATQAFLNHELDILPQIDSPSIEKFGLRDKEGVVLRSDPGLMVLFLAFQSGRENLSGGTVAGNPFRDRRVRMAVYHAVHADRLIQVIQKGYAIPATQLVAPAVYGFDSGIERLPYDPARARQLLAEAGYAKGFDVRLDTTNNRYRMDVTIGQAIAADLNAVGIRVQLNQKPLQEWLALRSKGESPFYLGGWACPSGDSSGALDYILHTPDPAHGYGSANSGGYSNPELDRLIEQCGQTMDPKTRLALLKAAMKLAMNDVAVVPLYIEQDLTAVRSDILWEPNPDQVIDLRSMNRR